jgi:hypothetical protein
MGQWQLILAHILLVFRLGGIVVGSFILPAWHGTYYMRVRRWNEWHHIIDATFIMVPRSPMDSNDSILVFIGGIVASSVVLDVVAAVAALGNAWCNYI